MNFNRHFRLMGLDLHQSLAQRVSDKMVVSQNLQNDQLKASSRSLILSNTTLRFRIHWNLTRRYLFCWQILFQAQKKLILLKREKKSLESQKSVQTLLASPTSSLTFCIIPQNVVKLLLIHRYVLNICLSFFFLIFFFPCNLIFINILLPFYFHVTPKYFLKL